MTIHALSRREIRPSRALALWKGAALSAEGAACYSPLQLVLCDAAHQDVKKELIELFHSYDSQYHPPTEAPATDVQGMCAAALARGGWAGPWRE